MTIREYVPAERAASARHEAEQRQREAAIMTFTRKIDRLHDANRLAWQPLHAQPMRHRLAEAR